MVEPANVSRLYPPVRSRVCVRMVAGPKLENWQVSRDQAITQLDPASGTPIGDEYIFDKVFVRESTKYLYDCLVKELIKEFCKKKRSAAVIIYGCSHTGKNECLLDTQKHDIGLLQSAFTDIVNYMAHAGDTYHLLRMSYVDVYREKVEDLLVTDLCNDTSVPKQGLQLTEDTSGYVVWLGAKEAVISSEKQLEYFYTKGHSEHVRRGHRTRGRLEAAHSIVRLVSEFQMGL
ncbi:kinesin-2b-like [Panulirus ornatus]|uniref:kinesin-2b-like n=1 Tax=Panulirus ornatus TaxID=150431 RepID=UPI003A87539C